MRRALGSWRRAMSETSCAICSRSWQRWNGGSAEGMLGSRFPRLSRMQGFVLFTILFILTPASHRIQSKLCGLCVCTWGTVFIYECISLFQQGPGPSGKNEEKVQVLTEKIEDLVVQVCNNNSEIKWISTLYCQNYSLTHPNGLPTFFRIHRNRPPNFMWLSD